MISENSKKTRAYMRRLMCGKNKFAYWTDHVLMTILSFLMSYFFFYLKLRDQLVSALLAFIVSSMLLVAVLCYKSIKLDKFTNRKLIALYEQALFTHLMVLPLNEQLALVASKIDKATIKENSRGFIIDTANCFYALISQHPEDKVTPTQVLKYFQSAQALHCSRLELYSTAEFNSAAIKLVDSLPIATKLHSPGELIQTAKSLNILPEKSAVEAQLSGLVNQKKDRRGFFKTALSAQNAKRYLYCAAIISIASFVTGYQVYYPIMASVCVCLALVSFYIARKKPAADEQHSMDT